jgi:hypothetical protein
VATHVAMCDVCQRVKAEHQRLAGLLHPLKVPEWKCEEIGMDFIVKLPRTLKGYDSIWVIMDRLTKVALLGSICWHVIESQSESASTSSIFHVMSSGGIT